MEEKNIAELLEQGKEVSDDALAFGKAARSF